MCGLVQCLPGLAGEIEVKPPGVGERHPGHPPVAGVAHPHHQAVALTQHQQCTMRLNRAGKVDQLTLAIAQVCLAKCRLDSHSGTCGRRRITVPVAVEALPFTLRVPRERLQATLWVALLML